MENSHSLLRAPLAWERSGALVDGAAVPAGRVKPGGGEGRRRGWGELRAGILELQGRCSDSETSPSGGSESFHQNTGYWV